MPTNRARAKKIPQQVKDRAVALALRGESLPRIEALTGLTRPIILSALRRAGVRLARPKLTESLTPEQADLAIALRWDGWTCRAIADYLGVSKGEVERAMERRSVKPRTRARRRMCTVCGALCDNALLCSECKRVGATGRVAWRGDASGNGL